MCSQTVEGPAALHFMAVEKRRRLSWPTHSPPLIKTDIFGGRAAESLPWPSSRRAPKGLQGIEGSLFGEMLERFRRPTAEADEETSLNSCAPH